MTGIQKKGNLQNVIKYFLKTFSTSSNRWVPGLIKDKTGPVSVTVRLYDGSVVHHHADHVHKQWVTDIENEPVITPAEVTTTSAVEWKVVQVNRVMERAITLGAMWI